MAVENWIDDVIKAIGKVKSHAGGTITVYRMAMRPDVPEVISTFPSVLIYPERLISAQYTAGGACKEVWEVHGKFYLFSDTKKTNLPEMIRYFAKIRNATLASITLGGKVDHFIFGTEPMKLAGFQDTVDGPWRDGIEVFWEVKSDVGAEVTVGP